MNGCDLLKKESFRVTRSRDQGHPIFDAADSDAKHDVCGKKNNKTQQLVELLAFNISSS